MVKKANPRRVTVWEAKKDALNAEFGRIITALAQNPDAETKATLQHMLRGVMAEQAEMWKVKKAEQACSGNSRYEYTFSFVIYGPTGSTTTHDADDSMFERDGWHRVWADVTAEGCFVVYRRERMAPTTVTPLTVSDFGTTPDTWQAPAKKK